MKTKYTEYSAGQKIVYYPSSEERKLVLLLMLYDSFSLNIAAKVSAPLWLISWYPNGSN